MPPERRYHPRPARGSVMGTFFIVFGTVFAALWFTTSMWPALVLLSFHFGRVFLFRASHASAVQRNQNAVNLLNAGRIDEAAEIFDDLARAERRTAAHPVYVFNRAVAYVLQGRARRAFSLFNAVERSRAFVTEPGRTYLPLLYIELGTCLALLGQLEQAQHYRALAHRTLDPADRGHPAIFLDALVLVRSGQLVEADAYIRGHWRTAEGTLRVPTMRALRVVSAFTIAGLASSRAPDVRGLLNGVRPCRRGEFDWVGAHWPELLAFLDAQGLR